MNPEIRVVAMYRLEENPNMELRFVYSEYGWIPELIIDHEYQEISRPPKCFAPSDEVIEKLNDQLFKTVGEILPPVGVFMPNRN
jgi:hypothetical protein